MQRWLWFIGLYLAGVVGLGLLAWVIRWLIKL